MQALEGPSHVQPEDMTLQLQSFTYDQNHHHHPVSVDLCGLRG